MKVNDKVPVTIGGHVVAQATVRELGDGTATLVVPATLVVMGTRTELADLPQTEPETETVITGVDRSTGEVTSDASPQPQQSAAADVDNSSNSGSSSNSGGSATSTDAQNVAPAQVVAPAVEPVAAPPTPESAPTAPVETNE